MNSMQLKDKLKNISNKENVDFNVVLRNYMYERFIERLANSKYKNNFIFKGGYLLSTIFGLNNRQTMDIDLALKNQTLSKENILNIMQEISEIDIKDDANIIINSISNIREDDEYGGYRIKLTVMIEKIKETFNIDVATGDPITPREINFKYKTMFDYKFINLKSYNFETILAEKIETILSRKEFNSRVKDFYDVYLIYNMAKNKINKEILMKAIINTFRKREFYDDIEDTINMIKDSYVLKQRWKSFSKQNKYAKNIEYDEIIECLISLIEIITVKG